MSLLPILIVFLVSNLGLAGGRYATRQDPSCRQNLEDSFDHGWRINDASPKFAQRCLDTSSARAAEILSETRDSMEFANFYHQKEFWYAHWDKSDVPKVQFSVIFFDVNVPVIGQHIRAAHAEIRYTLEQGLKLVSPKTGETRVVKQFTVDWEAGLPVGAQYDILTGISKNYVVVGRVASLEARTQETTRPSGVLQKTYTYDLELNPEQSFRLLRHSLHVSHLESFNGFYSTIKNNCVSKAFDAIDAILAVTNPELAAKIPPYRTPIHTDPVSAPSRKALILRQLIKADQQPHISGQ